MSHHSKKQDFIRIFEAHGVEFTGESGSQIYGFDPFSGKDNKFYANKHTGLWDSKTAGLSGNVAEFLHQRSKTYQQGLTKSLLRALAENRQLAPDAFKDWEVGYDGRSFTFPVRDLNGNVVDIRRYSLKTKLMRSTPGTHTGLIGAHRLLDDLKAPVYLCEGEWDAIALYWLLRSLEEPGVVVGVPGAGTFKPEWVPWLSKRIVHTMYDADPAGKKGEDLVRDRLQGHARKITYVHWPDDVPVGFDTRDWIVYGMTIRNTPEICLERLQRRFYDKPSDETKAKVTKQVVTKSGKFTIILQKKAKLGKWKKPPTIAQVHEVFHKWLFLRNNDVIDVMLATILSQRIDGSPVWMFLVGPPGSAKTAVVSSLHEMDVTYSTSSLTAPSLISGSMFGGNDPSLIPKLDGKVLVVKDFTAVLALPDREQKEIFGILRDAYDGRCGKSFGNGVDRHYESRFTILAATTPKIYDLAEQHQSLGERFLKFMVGDNLHHESENEVIRKAIENSDRATAMQAELQEAVRAYLERTTAGAMVPELSPAMMKKIISLAKFGARMRGTVSRDHFHGDVVLSRPTAEVGTRLGQQLAKLARGLAMVYGRKTVGESEYTLIKKVMLDTISQRNEDVLRAMILAMGGTDKLTPMSMRELAAKTHYPFATIQRLMQDLAALQIIKRQGAGIGTTWTLSEYVHKEVTDAELYTHTELVRPSIGRIRLIRRREKHHPRTVRAVPLGTVSINQSGSRFTIAPPTTPAPVPMVVPATPTQTPLTVVVKKPL